MEIYNQTLRTKGEDQLSNPAQEVEKLHVDFGWEKLVLPLAICLFWRVGVGKLALLLESMDMQFKKRKIDLILEKIYMKWNVALLLLKS